MILSVTNIQKRFEVFQRKKKESILADKGKMNIVIYGAYNPSSDSKHLGEKERLIKLRDHLREDGYINTFIVEEIPNPIGLIIPNLEKSLDCLEWADLNIIIFTCRGKTGGVARELIHAIDDPVILWKCRIFEEIDKRIPAIETLLKEELTSRRYEVAHFNREDDEDLYEHVSRDVSLFDWKKEVLTKIRQRANKACERSKGTTTEELACKINQEVQKWQISDQEQMTHNVNNLIFTLKAKISSYPTNSEIYKKIEKIGKENDLNKQYQLIAILIAIIPQTVIGGIMVNEMNENIGGDKIVAHHSSIVSKSSFSNAINTIKESGNYEIAKAIKDLAGLIENANFENRKETIENVESLAEEAAKQNPRIGTMRVLGESILNSVQQVSEIVEKVSPLIKIISKLWNF